MLAVQYTAGKSKSIPIPTSNIKKIEDINEPSYICHLFDPTKASPPNDFLRKLQVRMGTFGHSMSPNTDFNRTNA